MLLKHAEKYMRALGMRTCVSAKPPGCIRNAMPCLRQWTAVIGEVQILFSHVEKFQLIMICVYFEFQHGSQADHPIAYGSVTMSRGEWMKLIFNRCLLL